MSDIRRTILNAGPMFARPLPPSGGGVRSDTVVVASTTSSEASQADADYVCDTHNATPTVQIALDRLGVGHLGGSLRLLEGAYLFPAGVIVPSTVNGVTISGVSAQATGLLYAPTRTMADRWVLPVHRPLFNCVNASVQFVQLSILVLGSLVEHQVEHVSLILGSRGSSVDIDRCILDAGHEAITDEIVVEIT